eukprot:Sdes_comp20305_c0_seq1m13923
MEYLENHPGIRDIQEAMELAKKNNASKANNRNFWRIISKGIQRPLIAIYKHLYRLYGPGTDCGGRFSEEEDKKLRRLMAIHGPKWMTIGAQMGRSDRSVSDRWRILAAEEKHGTGINGGPFSQEEDQRLLDAVRSLTAGNIPDSGIPWTAVSEMVGSRNYYQCKGRWSNMVQRKLKKKSNSKPSANPADSALIPTKKAKLPQWNNSADDDLELLRRIDACSVVNETDLVWSDLARDWCWNSKQLYSHWFFLKTKVPGAPNLPLDEIIDYLKQNYIPSTERTGAFFSQKS